MKKISIAIPCYNEEKNVIPMAEKLINIFENELPQYDYEIVFADNCSQDNTRALLRGLCAKNKRIKAIFNTRNFGVNNSCFNLSRSLSGDCTIGVVADFQYPPELIPQFVKEWENGYKLVIGIRVGDCENKLMRFVRHSYYKLIKKFSWFETIENFSGFALVDKSYVNLKEKLQDANFDERGFLAYTGIKRKEIPFVQPKRASGKSSYNFFSYYNEAMIGFTSNTKAGLRIATFSGMILGTISFIIAIVYLVLKLLRWDSFSAGYAPMIIGVFLLGSFQLFFIGLLGEYIMAINTRQMNWPLVVEEERINFDDDKKYS